MGTQFHPKGVSPPCKSPPTPCNFCPFLVVPGALNWKWAKSGKGTNNCCCPELPPDSCCGHSQSTAGCWATRLLPRQQMGLLCRSQVRRCRIPALQVPGVRCEAEGPRVTRQDPPGAAEAPGSYALLLGRWHCPRCCVRSWTRLSPTGSCVCVCVWPQRRENAPL